MFLISCYNVFFCTFIVLIELECMCLISIVPLMKWWTLRGISLVFAALLASHTAYFVHSRTWQVFQDIASISLGMCGGAYGLLGICGGAYTEKSIMLADLEAERQREVDAVNKRWESARSEI
jgi:hypothetical protein